MSRISFLENKQSDFLSRIKKKYKLKWSDIARACKVHKRTLFDWRRNKYQMSYIALEELRKKYSFVIPRKLKILPENWNIDNAARLGAIRRNALHGNPGTPEGRRKGGVASLKIHKLNHEKFINTGFIGPKEIKYPHKSILLSEAVGIILGDGSITKYQLAISLNSKTEKQYSDFVSRLLRKLFAISVTRNVRENNTCDLVVSSVKLIQYLNDLGLKVGHKIHQQVSIPKWILKNKNYMIGCVRGLIDTDGGVYYHNHITKGIRYRHLGLCFTSYSMPLLRDVHNIFLNLGFPAKLNHRGHVFLYDSKAIKRYFIEIETHNTHHFKRFRDYFKSGEVREWSIRRVWSTRVP